MTTIYSLGDAAFLYEVLMALASITGSGELDGMLAFGLVLGVVIAALQFVTSMGRFLYVRGIFAGLVLYLLMFSSTQTVTVEDVYSGSVRVVAGVPTGVAVLGGGMSFLGYRTTELFEAAFSAPEMTRQGYNFAPETLKTVRLHSLAVYSLGAANAPVPGADVAQSWTNYIRECTTGALTGGHKSLDELSRAVDFMEALRWDSRIFGTRIWIGGPARDLDCTDAHLELSTFTRDDFLPDFLSLVLARSLDAVDGADALARVQSALDSLGLTAASAEDYILASVLVPLYDHAVKKWYQDHFKYAYATAIDDAIRARNAEWLGGQSLFNRYLRPVLTFLEGFVFAITPIAAIFLVAGVTGYAMATRLILLMFWIQLWMPCLAIVHLYTHMALAARLDALDGAGTFITSMAGLLNADDAILDYLAVAGNIAAGVPGLALLLAYGGAITATSFATMLSRGDHINEGQIAPRSFEVAPQTQVLPRREVGPLTGAYTTGYGNLLETFSYRTGQERSVEAAEQQLHAKTQAFGTRVARSVAEVWSDDNRANDSTVFNESWRSSGSAARSFMEQHFKDAVESFSARTGISEQDAYRISGNIALGLAASDFIPDIAKNIPGAGTFLKTSPRVGADANYTGSSVSETEALDGLERSIKESLGNSSTWSADFMRAVARDESQGREHSLVNSEIVRDENAYTREASEVVSAQQSHSEALRAYAGASTARELPAATMAGLIAANPELMADLGSRIQLYELQTATQAYADDLARSGALQHFGGDHDKLYAYAALATLGNEGLNDQRAVPADEFDRNARLRDRDALFEAALGGGRLPSIYGEVTRQLWGMDPLEPEQGPTSSRNGPDAGDVQDRVEAGLETPLPPPDDVTERFATHGAWATESAAEHRQGARQAIEHTEAEIAADREALESDNVVTSTIQDAINGVNKSGPGDGEGAGKNRSEKSPR